MPLKNGRTTAALQTIVVGSVIPPGTIQAFGGGTVPHGWLLCDGSTVNRAAYPELFAAIGTAHGAGNGSTTFHLPDYRGRFLRGADNMGTGAAGRDPDANSRTAANAGGSTGSSVGSVQGANNLAHRHNTTLDGQASTGLSFQSQINLTTYNTANGGYEGYFSRGTASTTEANASLSSTSGGNEARPQNANILYIIKV